MGDAAQLVEGLFSVQETSGLISAPHGFNQVWWHILAAKEGGSGVQSHSQLHVELEGSLGYATM